MNSYKYIPSRKYGGYSLSYVFFSLVFGISPHNNNPKFGQKKDINSTSFSSASRSPPCLRHSLMIELESYVQSADAISVQDAISLMGNSTGTYICLYAAQNDKKGGKLGKSWWQGSTINKKKKCLPLHNSLFFLQFIFNISSFMASPSYTSTPLSPDGIKSIVK